jgi:hypothetical protein
MSSSSQFHPPADAPMPDYAISFTLALGAFMTGCCGIVTESNSVFIQGMFGISLAFLAKSSRDLDEEEKKVPLRSATNETIFFKPPLQILREKISFLASDAVSRFKPNWG